MIAPQEGVGSDTNTEQYAWAIISDAQGKTVYVLARNESTFADNYDTAVKSALDGITVGITGSDALKAVYQSATECNYPPLQVAEQNEQLVE